MMKSRWIFGISLIGFLASALACGEVVDPQQEPPPEPPASPEIVSFDAERTQVERGETVSISWLTRHAASIELKANGEPTEFGEMVAESGTVAVQILETTQFELVAKGAEAGEEVSKTLLIELLPPELPEAPLIGSFEAEASVIGRQPDGKALAVLRWSGVERAEDLVLSSESLGQIPLPVGSLAKGTVEVGIEEDTTFELLATNEGGEDRREVSIRVVERPTILSFTGPAFAGPWQDFEIHWETADAVAISITLDGIQILSESAPTSGSHTLFLQADGTLELEAVNETGDVETRDLLVSIVDPAILSFDASPAYAWTRGTIALHWETLGALDLELRDEGGDALCAAGSLEEARQGSCTAILAEEGSATFELEIRSGSLLDTRTVTVEASSGPQIVDFSVDPVEPLIGEEVTVSWVVRPDPAGRIPTLLLSHDRGGSLALAQELEGSAPLILNGLGAYELRLTATTSSPGSVPASAVRQLTAWGLPEVSLDADVLTLDYSVRDSASLSWTSIYSEGSLVVFELDPLGQPIPATLYEVPPAERASGSMEVSPLRDTTWRIVAENGKGDRSSADLRLSVVSTEIDSFTATPTRVLAGERVTLQWRTTGASWVGLDFVSPLVAEGASLPFTEIGPVGDKVLLQSCGGSCATVDLPAGFTFPFGGVEQSRIRVYVNGVAGFSLGYEGPSHQNAALAQGSNTWANLAPFWDELSLSEQGGIHTFRSRDELGDSFIIQWSYLRVGGSGDLNFQVVLRPDGTFEYRYGLMLASDQNRADGSSATIGYQLPSGTLGELIHFGNPHGAPMTGGLGGKAWRVRQRPSLGSSGSHSWTPAGNPAVASVVRPTTLTALGTEVRIRTQSVEVFTPASVSLSASRDPVVGEAFTLSWTSQFAASLQLLTEGGQQVCSIGSSQIPASSCTRTESSAGTYRYTLRAEGPLGSQVEQTLSVRVAAPLEISEFSAASDVIDRGQSVILSWKTTGAESLQLEANGVPLSLGPVDLDVGSFSHTPSVRTTYTLKTAAADRSREATATVTVRTVDLELIADTYEVHPGGLATAFWSTRAFGAGTPVVQAMIPMREVSATSPYEDISTTGQLLLGPSWERDQWATVDLGGIAFPYFGSVHTRVRVSSQGILSFDTSLTGDTPGRTALPATGPVTGRYALIPFWANVKTQELENPFTNSGVYGKFVPAAGGVPAHYIVQYHHHGFLDTGVRDGDLNFQVALFGDGSFEYRYAAMLPLNQRVVLGERTTIGYQAPGTTQASTLHYGGPNAGGVPVALEGGLANRSWRFESQPLTGSVALHPISTSDLYVCAVLDAYSECKTITVKAEFLLESFTVSNGSPTLGDEVLLQWETKGADTWTLEANGVLLGDQTTLPSSGSLGVVPEDTTDYVLRIGSFGRVLEETRRVTLKLFELETWSSASLIHPGDPVVLNWKITPETSAPYMVTPMMEVGDSFDSIANLPNVQTLFGPGATNTAAIVTLPFGDFVFPYFGKPQTMARVSINGFLSFDPTANNLTNNTTTLPSTQKTNLAPFWDQNYTRESGRVYAAQVASDQFVIEWSHMSTAGSANATQTVPVIEHDLNYQIVLFADGSFEFRYGVMDPLRFGATSRSCFPNDCSNEARGSSATIGYQLPGGQAGYLLHYGGANGNLANPYVVGGLAHRTWRYFPSRGSGAVQVQHYDTKTYQICGTRGVNLVCQTLLVEAPWRIDSLRVDRSQTRPNDPINLSWTTTGADQLVLRANGAPIDLTGKDLDEDTIAHVPTTRTTYELEMISAGRSLTREVIVDLQTVDVLVETSRVQALPGDSITFEWDATSLTGDPVLIATPMLEIDSPYTDISTSGTLLSALNNTDYAAENVAIPFDFPFFGATYDTVRVLTGGYISFNTTTDSDPSNTTLPNAATYKAVKSFAVFWDDLHSRNPGRVYWQHFSDPAGDSLIVQWTTFSFRVGSSASTNHDLNFQIVLHEDGRVEYRYGSMIANGKQADANGASATIGYQDTTGTVGGLVTFNKELAGGLSNRSFLMFPAAPKGSITLPVNGTTDFKVCAKVDTFLSCETATIFVPGPGDVMLTELMLAPTAGGQWFELRSLAPLPLDLQGWTLRTDAGSHLIASPLVVQPGAYVTLAASPTPGFTPTYVFGEGLSLNGAVDSLALSVQSKLISEVRWGPTWTIPAGSSLELETLRQNPGIATFGSQGDFCKSLSVYDSTQTGTPGAKPSCSIFPYYFDANATMAAIDISAVGVTPSHVIGARRGDRVELGFSFPFFDEVHTSLLISARGTLSMTAAYFDDFTNPTALPGTGLPATGGLIAPLWTNFSGVAEFKWATVERDGRKIAVFDWKHWKTPENPSNDVSFQIQLWENGDIYFIYGELIGDDLARGAISTVGLQSVGSSRVAMPYSYQQPKLSSGQVIHFRRL